MSEEIKKNAVELTDKEVEEVSGGNSTSFAQIRCQKCNTRYATAMNPNHVADPCPFRYCRYDGNTW